MWKRGGVSRNPTGGAAIVFEHDCREWRHHTVCVVDNGRDGVIRQLSLQGGLPVVVIAVRERGGKQGLHRRERHGLDRVKNRFAKRAERPQHTFSGRDRSAVAGNHGDEWRAIGTMQERGVRRQFVGSGCDEVTEVTE